MKTCPACGEHGIGEHSALIRLDPRRAEPRARALAAFTTCVACGAVFRFEGSSRLEPEPRDILDEEVAWIVPPWLPRSLESEFELSWDLAERHFRAQVRATSELETLVGLIGALRGAGLGARLRAGYDEGSFVLSRTRDPRLAPDDRFVAFVARDTGSVGVRAKLSGEMAFGPVPASYDGDLKLVVDALAAAPPGA